MTDQLYDGPTTASPLIGTHCGSALPPSYVSTANEMLVVMRSDGILSAKGFKAKYFSGCGARIVVRDEGYLTPSTSYTADMQEDGVNCTWILIAEDPGNTFYCDCLNIRNYLGPRAWSLGKRKLNVARRFS